MRLELVLTLAAVVLASTCCQIALGEKNSYQYQQGQSSLSSGAGSTCTPSCQNGGLCRQEVNSEAYYCDCSGTGYTGVSCLAPSRARLLSQSRPPASSLSACTPTCQNGGLCTQAVNSDVYYCDCSSTGYTGATCAILSSGSSPPTSSTSACTPTCQNGGMCRQEVNSEAYYCDCSSTGYTGATCSTPSSSSSLPTSRTSAVSGPPASSTSACIPACQNGGACTQAVNSDVYYCDCSSTGYTGATCSALSSRSSPPSISPAASNTSACTPACQNGGACTQAVNSEAYYCDCSSTGYKGATCSAPRTVIGAPASSTSPCTPACRNRGSCKQAVNSEAYYCDCSGTGFTGAACTAQNASTSPAAAIPAVSTSAAACTPACRNGGSCMQAVNSDAYYCDCSNTGFRGASCSAQITAYSPAPSAASSLSACSPPCKNGGACTQAVNSDVYYCDCQSTGFSGQDCSISHG